MKRSVFKKITILVFNKEMSTPVKYPRDFAKIKKTIGFIPRWLFPGLNVDNHISKSSIDRKFQAFWNMTECSRKCDKKPTPHCLRHTFVVDRINLWVMNDIDINTMMPYLSKYLGHKSPDETFYYLNDVKTEADCEILIKEAGEFYILLD